MRDIACPYCPFAGFIHIRESECKGDRKGKAAGSGRFHSLLGDMLPDRMFTYCGDRSVRKTQSSPAIQFAKCRGVPFLIIFPVSKEGRDKDHDLGVIGKLTRVQAFVGMALIRAPVPVFHLIEVGRCAFIGHTECVSNGCTQQTPREFLKHRSYIEKPGQIILVISIEDGQDLLHSRNI
jgi:hypothetical protein